MSKEKTFVKEGRTDVTCPNESLSGSSHLIEDRECLDSMNIIRRGLRTHW